MTTDLRMILTGAACLILTACFVSTEPLIDPADAAYPLSPAQYAYYEGDPERPEDGHNLEWQGDISIKDGRYATSVDPDDFPYQDSYFAELEDGIWIAQHAPEPHDDGYFYTLLHADPEHVNRFIIEWVICEPLSDETRDDLGVVMEDDVCEFTDLDTLKAGMRAWLAIRDDIEDLGDFPDGYSYLERLE